MTKPVYKLIVARNEQNIIGVDGKIPWIYPEDMTHFRSTTMGHHVVMGRKTFESLPNGALQGRTNHVITRTRINLDPPGPKTPILHNSVDDFKKWVEDNLTNGETIFVIGGGSIYSQFMDIVSEAYVTTVPYSVPTSEDLTKHKSVFSTFEFNFDQSLEWRFVRAWPLGTKMTPPTNQMRVDLYKRNDHHTLDDTLPTLADLFQKAMTTSVVATLKEEAIAKIQNDDFNIKYNKDTKAFDITVSLK